MTAKILSGKSVRTKPPKVKGSPLTPHASGQYCARLNGKIRYFGKDHAEALRKYLDAQAGFDVHDKRASVKTVCDAYMDAQQAKVDQGELEPRTLSDYHAMVKRFASFAGRDRPFESLGPKDFAELRSTYTGAASTVNREVGMVRSLLNWARASEFGNVNPGPNFSMVSKRAQRLERKAKGPKLFTARELWAVLRHACPQLRAMTLLAINCGFGNTDCNLLEISDIDFDRGWLSVMRNKTAVDRDAALWPETVKALKEAIANRYEPSDDAFSDRVFITKYKGQWLKPHVRTNAISQAFTKLTRKAGIYKPGLSFYGIRHTFRTVADNARDVNAVRRIMGHVDDSIDQTYIESLDRKRIESVCEYVRRWFLAGRYHGKRYPKPNGESVTMRGAKR